VCENRLDALYPALKKEKGRPKPEDLFTVLAKMKGAELKGIKYVPLFTYFEKVKLLVKAKDGQLKERHRKEKMVHSKCLWITM
jgi:hypothetical protein